MHVHVCNQSSDVFAEVEAAMVACFRRLGHEVTHESELLVSGEDTVSITLAMYFDPNLHAAALNNHIIFNFEQLGTRFGAAAIQQNYFRLMRNAFVWDYSAEHILELQQGGIEQCCHVPLGFSSVYEPIHPAKEHRVEQDIDVLFYGALTNRRMQILDSLRARGHRVEILPPHAQWGQARADCIARAKVLLNVACFEDMHTLEVVRMAPWWGMGCAVVSELGPHSRRDARLDGAYLAAPYDQLVQACEELLGDEGKRNALARDGARIFRQTSFDESLEAGLQAFIRARQTAGAGRVKSGRTKAPAQLRYQSTKGDWDHRYLCVSPDAADDPDVLLSLSQWPDLCGQSSDSWRFGLVHWAANSLDRVEIYRPCQSPVEMMALFKQCARLLAIKGVLALYWPSAELMEDESRDFAGEMLLRLLRACPVGSTYGLLSVAQVRHHEPSKGNHMRIEIQRLS